MVKLGLDFQYVTYLPLMDTACNAERTTHPPRKKATRVVRCRRKLQYWIGKAYAPSQPGRGSSLCYIAPDHDPEYAYILLLSCPRFSARPSSLNAFRSL